MHVTAPRLPARSNPALNINIFQHISGIIGMYLQRSIPCIRYCVKYMKHENFKNNSGWKKTG